MQQQQATTIHTFGSFKLNENLCNRIYSVFFIMPADAHFVDSLNVVVRLHDSYQKYIKYTSM